MLEAAQYTDNCFLTMTYSDEYLPSNLSVSPRTLSLFMKRLRKSWPDKIRYFGCGEYGDTTMRPHYHLALFNFPSCIRGQTRLTKENRPCCEICSLVQSAWPYGGVMLGSLEQASIAYVAGYVTKKMTKHDDPRLEGRLPEFARMSLRPGIGLGMMHELASTLLTHKLDERMIDVPTSLQHGKKKLPLGRYLRRKLRTFIGQEANAPLASFKELEDKMQLVRQVAWDTEKPVKEVLLETTLGKRLQIHAREKRFKKAGNQ